MKHRTQPLRLIIVSCLLMCLLTGLAGITRLSRQVHAAPLKQVALADVLISEFRFLGPQGGNDEFIELYNPKSTPVDITGFRIMGSNNSGGTALRATIGSVTLQPGGHYLLVNTGASAGLLALQDATYTTGMTDDGGIAIMDASGTIIIDAVGLSAGSAYKEGTVLAPLSGTADQSYERKIAGETRNCNDTNNNAADFLLNPSSINPQNSASPAAPCLYVTNVTSSTPDGTYTTLPVTVNITVTFSGPVFVAGTPTLQLETGITDRAAAYVSGSGTNTLTFQYNAVAGDFTNDLDYVSATALSGSIYDIVGNAILTLPTPGSAGSLGANKAIAINIDNGTPPSTVSIRRQTPATNLTNADSLVFRVSFSENVTGVDAADFIVHLNAPPPTTTAIVSGVNPISASVYDVTVSGGDLAGFSGVVGLDISAAPSINDQTGNPLPTGDPAAVNDETYLLDNTAPSVTVNQAAGQADPTGVTPINFTVVFSEPIVVSTFTTADITAPGTVTWNLTNPSGDRRTFNLTATAITQTNLVLTPTIAAGRATDDAGNGNQASTGLDNSVTFTDITAPTVTVNQAVGQTDPTTVLPVRFTVVFSEPIAITTFTPSDITSSGTATITTWIIANAGDNRTFTISATVVTTSGTIIPSITANRVTDVAGNLNVASTSTDNSVRYNIPPTATPTLSRTPTRTRTPTLSRTPTRRPTQTSAPLLPLVAINEFVPRPGHDWNNDGQINTGDEYIELVNHGSIDVNLNGYSLDDEANIGSSPYKFPSITIKPGQRIVFYGDQTGLLLSDGGDGVRLLRPNGQLMDAFNYTTVGYPDQAYCRLPDNGGADDWNESCYPTPGQRNSFGSFGTVLSTPLPPSLCPFSDIAPADFVVAECDPFGNNIWRPAYWDDPGWLDGQYLPKTNSKWDIYAD